MTSHTLDQFNSNNEKLSPWPWQVNDAELSFDIDSLGKTQRFKPSLLLSQSAEKGLGIAQTAEVTTKWQPRPLGSHPVSAFAPPLHPKFRRQ